jgi:hypothetical protein
MPTSSLPSSTGKTAMAMAITPSPHRRAPGALSHAPGANDQSGEPRWRVDRNEIANGDLSDRFVTRAHSAV